ncbi:MAG: glycosyltransferase family 39 protein [Candidatus Levybacteria bacterium]|nr:glycosyltransferase family 39 protein [Candidatus Levybacteria bacterium]
MLQRIRIINLLLTLALVYFFVYFLIQANNAMRTIPFYDFDEAHRAETAKRMKEYKSFFVPLTGSVYDRVEKLKIPFTDDPHLFLYYHLERPPLIYMLMIVSTTIFGDTEWAYRLPSFIMGMIAIIGFLVFAKIGNKNIQLLALYGGLLTFLTSADLWLSSQYAQLDTGVSAFLFISVLALTAYCMQRKTFFIITSGIFFALSVLAKGQPAVLLLFPLLYLVFTKKLSRSDITKFLYAAGALLAPWILYLLFTFGLTNILNTFFGFAIATATQQNFDHTVPFFWYIRWWFVTLRPGLILFLVLAVYDSVKGKLNLQRKILLIYIFGGLIFFSLFENKFWWYVLPLIPAMSFYIVLSLNDVLNGSKNMIKIAFIIFLASAPILLNTSNIVSMLYGGLITGICLFIMFSKRFEKVFVHVGKTHIAPYLLLFSFTSSLVFFSQHFPYVAAHNAAEKPIALIYKDLPGIKCLWFKNMPSEAILFYSNAGSVREFTENTNLFPHCQNYLITHADIDIDNTAYRDNINKTHYLKNATVIKEIGNLKLVKLPSN